jgi:hypothetical protein
MGEGPISLDQTLGTQAFGATGCFSLSNFTGASGFLALVELRRTRGRRLDRIRSRTLSGPIRLDERATDDELEDLSLEPRPATWAECATMPRPCPYVSCKHHLYIEVNPLTGSVQFPFGHMGIDEIPHTCSIDAALEGPLTLEEVGKLTSRTKERIRQIETRALVTMRSEGISPSMLDATMADWLEDL